MLKAKQKIKDNADSKVKEKENVIKLVDMVSVRQKKQNKFSAKFDPALYRVAEVKGTMITALQDKRSIMRNISHFKLV